MSKSKERKKKAAMEAAQKQEVVEKQQQAAADDKFIAKIESYYGRVLAAVESLSSMFEKEHTEFDKVKLSMITESLKKEIAEEKSAVLSKGVEPSTTTEALYGGKYDSLEELYFEAWATPMELDFPEIKKPAKSKKKKDKKKAKKPDSSPEAEKPTPKTELKPERVDVLLENGEIFPAEIYPLRVFSGDEHPIWVFDTLQIKSGGHHKKVSLEVAKFEKPLKPGKDREVYWKVIGVYDPETIQDRKV